MSRAACVAAAAAVLATSGGVRAQRILTNTGAVNWLPVDTAKMVWGCCGNAGPPVLEAERVSDAEIRIDGRAVELAWKRAPVATHFVQYEPGDGDPATERTEARVLYGEDALYVSIRAYDSHPDQIVGQLARRDQDSYSDQVGVIIDSYFDRRTAFHFQVNPVGVKTDIYRFDDTNEDSGWDAVWDAATSRDDEGWTAEFRIPYSQLRFKDQATQTWGINFVRVIARKHETVVWAPVSRRESAVVSKFGELRGLENLKAPNHLEVIPYTLARLERAPGDVANPFHRANATAGAVGADVKYGLTSNLTLNVTLNPDFGQVEADPAQVNLTAFETFLPERRPFFLEGASIYRFGIALGDGDNANESLFYSRRIGRAPQGSPDDQGGFVDAPEQTTILGAWKLSGKTAGGWSIGALQALTAEETARVAPASGPQTREAVEPFTNYGVLRLQKDFREGRSAFGVIATTVNRDRGVADPLDLHTGAWTGGVDFRHRFAGEKYSLDGYFLGSYVRGSPEAIAATQESAAHYYQRPDAKRFSFDPTRTSLSGGSAYLSIAKIGGGHWRFSTGLHTRSPGFEVNDIGYERDADSFTNWAWVGYRQTTAQGPFQSWNLNTNAWTSWNYDGDHVGLGGNVNGSAQFKNFWSAYAGVNHDASAYSGRALRGGPLFRVEPSTNFWAGMNTNTQKAVSLNLSTWGDVRSESDSWSVGVSPGVSIRPSARASFRLGTSLSRNVDDRQWVEDFQGTPTNYVFGRIDQTTAGLTARMDYALSPTLSLQLYAEPFVSAGRYSAFKRVADPRAARYSERFEPLATREADGVIYTDIDGDGTEDSFDTPDFNFKQFRSNTVLRWEYRPGSTIYVVWSQGRNDSVDDGAFDFRSDVNTLFDVHPRNVFMIKASYWLSH